jgi:hypothetical protein
VNKANTKTLSFYELHKKIERIPYTTVDLNDQNKYASRLMEKDFKMIGSSWMYSAAGLQIQRSLGAWVIQFQTTQRLKVVSTT